MWFLFFQIWVWLLIAFALGWFAHWFICCRGGNSSASKPDKPARLTETSTAHEEPERTNDREDDSNSKPMLFASAPEKIDDLKQIKGVGQVLETTLHELGIYQYEQIAAWSEEHIAWMDNFLSFSGRIDREDWRGQAKILAGGGETEFAQRVADGDVEY